MSIARTGVTGSCSGSFGGSGGSVLNWLVAFMLIVALALSALNAIMGCARSLHQMSVDGQFPRWFQRINHHGVPDRAMFFRCRLAAVKVERRSPLRSRLITWISIC